MDTFSPVFSPVPRLVSTGSCWGSRLGMGQMGYGCTGKKRPLSLDTCGLISSSQQLCGVGITITSLWIRKLSPRQEQRAAPGQTQREPGLKTRLSWLPSAAPLQRWRCHRQGTAPILVAPFPWPSHWQPPLKSRVKGHQRHHPHLVAPPAGLPWVGLATSLPT